MRDPIRTLGPLLLLLVGCGGTKTEWTQAEQVEREPKGGALLAHPVDGAVAGVNPPAFFWTPNDKAKAYRLELAKEGGARVSLPDAESLRSTVYPPYRKLEPGRYLWQVVYLNADGAPAGVSKRRSFTMPERTPELLMQDVAAIQRQLVGVRPRLFLKGDAIDRLQQRIKKGDMPSFDRLRQAADAALAEPSYPEPTDRPQTTEWDEVREAYLPAKIGSAHAVRTALMYRLTGDPKYLAGARRWLLTLASWDPKGVTSYRLKFAEGVGHSEGSMPILDRMSLAWDWMGDRLTADERQKVIASMTERGNQMLRILEESDFLTRPVSNHAGRAIAFLGDAGVAFSGDVPESAKWLDYSLRSYLTSSPGFGGDEGGWAQGMSYWSHYIYCHANFARVLRQATGVNLFVKPFFRNTGYFGLYCLPPYAPQGGFGDGAYHRPNESASVLAATLAEEREDPVMKWYADALAESSEKNENKWREWYTEDVYETLLAAAPPKTRPQTPVRLDGSRYFADVGWVAMHSALGDAANDVWALFKSSRFGSYSHSHADQNSFQFYAYGRPIAIDGGYHPALGSPHDGLYTRQTRAHNAILVNGRGQPSTTWAAAGRIDEFRREGILTLARGQAAEAYNTPQTPAVLKLWKKYDAKTPVPPMTIKVESCERTLIFAASKTRPVLVIHDYVRTGAPTTFEWLLHTLDKLQMDPRTGSLLAGSGDARVAVRLVATAPIRFSQNDRFSIPPEAPDSTAYIMSKDTYPNQWNFDAATEKPSLEVKFLVLLVPYRVGEAEPDIVPIAGADVKGFSVGGAKVAAWWGNGAQGKIAAGDLAGEGRLIMKVNENGRESAIVAR